MKKALTLAGMLSVFAALPATAHEWSDTNRTKMLDHMMALMDANGDGFISESEHEAASAEMFTNADVNGDGYLSREEISAYASKMRKDAGITRDSERTAVTNPHPRKN